MCWAYITTDRNDYSSILCFGTSTASDTREYTLAAGSDGTTLQVWNGSVETTGSGLGVATWNHVALTVAGTGANQCIAYLNGVANITMAGYSGPVAQKLYVGTNPYTEWWNGRLAALKVWGAVLTVDEIVQEMRWYVPIRGANLNTWVPCVEPVANDNAKDFGGIAGDMTVAGTITVEDGPPIAWAPQPWLSRKTVSAPAGSTLLPKMMQHAA